MRMFNSIIIIKLFYNVIFLFITTLGQGMFIVHFFLEFIPIVSDFFLLFLVVRTQYY